MTVLIFAKIRAHIKTQKIDDVIQANTVESGPTITYLMMTRFRPFRLLSKQITFH